MLRVAAVAVDWDGSPSTTTSGGDQSISLDTISRVAKGLAEHGAAFGHWAEYVCFGEDDLDRFEEVYPGCWETLAKWAEDVVDDLGVTEQLEAASDWLQPYVSIDFEQLGRDMAMDYHTADDDDGVHIYDARCSTPPSLCLVNLNDGARMSRGQVALERAVARRRAKRVTPSFALPGCDRYRFQDLSLSAQIEVQRARDCRCDRPVRRTAS